MQMFKKYIYFDSTGRITNSCVSLSGGNNCIEVAIDYDIDLEANYVVDGQIVNKPEMGIVVNKGSIIADGVDVWSATNVPMNAFFQLEPNNFQVIGDGVIELTFDEPGDYEVTIECHPYMKWRSTIHAT